MSARARFYVTLVAAAVVGAAYVVLFDRTNALAYYAGAAAVLVVFVPAMNLWCDRAPDSAFRRRRPHA